MFTQKKPAKLFAALLTVSIVVLFFAMATPSESLVAQESAFTSPSSRLSADVLKANLVAKSPSEAAYLDDVAARRDRGLISDRAVNSAYRYAMKKNRDRRVQYFAAALNVAMQLR